LRFPQRRCAFFHELRCRVLHLKTKEKKRHSRRLLRRRVSTLTEDALVRMSWSRFLKNVKKKKWNQRTNNDDQQDFHTMNLAPFLLHLGRWQPDRTASQKTFTREIAEYIPMVYHKHIYTRSIYCVYHKLINMRNKDALQYTTCI
jgi:hypothetical protein